jgi:hypothetical protein
METSRGVKINFRLTDHQHSGTPGLETNQTQGNRMDLPPRWAFERMEVERAKALGYQPNLRNVDVIMGAPHHWQTHVAFAKYLFEQEKATCLPPPQRWPLQPPSSKPRTPKMTNQTTPPDLISTLAARFCQWPLPNDFTPDGGCIFTPPAHINHPWPTGTNLLTVTQAEAMLRFVLDDAAITGGWIVGNASADRWRSWGALGPCWTSDRDKATRFARREDAEAVHAEDEDAWRVELYAALADHQPAPVATSGETPEGRLQAFVDYINSEEYKKSCFGGATVSPTADFEPLVIQFEGTKDTVRITGKDIAATLHKLALAREALAQYGNDLCEMGEAHDCCGKLSPVECGGCAAKKTLAQ